MKNCSLYLCNSEQDEEKLDFEKLQRTNENDQPEVETFTNFLPGVDKQKQKVLKQFDQCHVLEGYAKLGHKQQEKLMTDLELIHFDFVDLVFHNLIRKKKAQIAVDPGSLSMIKSEDFIQKNPTREDFEDTLKLVSEGKLCFVVAAGLSKKVKGDSRPKLSYVPDWGSEVSLLEAVVRRAKEICQAALESFGKNYAKKREPIMIYLMVNTAEVGQVQQFLAANKHFDYAGIVTFGQEVLPFINEVGRMVFADDSRERIRLVSNGSGGLLSALKAQGLLAHMLANGVEVLQFFDLNNLAIPLAEPQLVQEARRRDLVLQLNWAGASGEPQPVVYFNEQSRQFEYFNQREVQFIRRAPGGRLATPYEMKSLNAYLNIELLKKAANSAESLFDYRIKEQLTINKQGRESSMSGEILATESSYFSFELHFLNVLKLARDVKFFLLPDAQDVTVLRLPAAGWVPGLFTKELETKLPEILSFVTPSEHSAQIMALPLGRKLELFLLTSYCFNERKFAAFWARAAQ